jgi:hypothetical protein
MYLYGVTIQLCLSYPRNYCANKANNNALLINYNKVNTDSCYTVTKINA